MRLISSEAISPAIKEMANPWKIGSKRITAPPTITAIAVINMGRKRTTPASRDYFGQNQHFDGSVENFFIDRYPQSYVNEIDSFLNVLQGRETDYPDLKSGYLALYLSMAALESAKTGKPVEIEIE